MKNQKGFSIILLIAIGAIIATFGWVAYATWQQSVDDSNLTLTIPFVKHKVKNVNTNSAVNTNTSTASNTNSATVPSTDVVDSANDSLHTYTSYKLGVEFQYTSTTGEPVAILEQGSRIYVYFNDKNAVPTQGQWLEVFSKSATATLQRTVTDTFLKNYNAKDCYVTPGTGIQGTQSKTGLAVVINYPAPTAKDDPWFANAKNCPKTYSLTNGVSYFWAPSNTTDKYVFYSIGQYAIPGTSLINPWHETVSFLPSTTSWKTYTNTDFSFSIKHPADWKVTTSKSNNATAITLQTANKGDSVTFFPEGEFDFGVPSYKNTTTVTLGGKAANRVSYSANADGSNPTVCYYQYTTVPEAGWVAPNSEGKNGNRIHTTCTESATVKTMLSTLTFDETLGWKTYTNTTHGYSIRYPQTWSVLEEANIRSTQLLPPGVSGTLSGENAIKGAITLQYQPTADEMSTVINRKDITINDIAAQQGSDPGITAFTATLIPKVNPTHTIYWATKYTNVEYNTILSTFTFTPTP